MDLQLLHSHAKRYGKWDIQATARDNLSCEHHRPTNADSQQWDDFSYYLNGKRIGADHADAILEGLFAQSLGLQLVEKVT